MMKTFKKFSNNHLLEQIALYCYFLKNILHQYLILLNFILMATQDSKEAM